MAQDPRRMTQIPAEGVEPTQLLQTLREYRAADADWRNGRCFSLVYHAGDAHSDILKEAHNLYFSENGLNPMAFKSLKKMEHEVVQMSARLLNGPPDAVGTMTSGGTESILMAMKAARDRAKSHRPGLTHPEVVLPITAHVAFDKAAHYFGLTLRKAPVKKDFRVDVAAAARLINRNTVLLVGSAPQYPQGVMDPISDLSALALRHKLPLHVDACVGGFVLPWLERLGEPIPLWDFRLPGVTSISADLHKYGYTAKGASVILYRSMDYLKHQFFVCTDWPGGVYASPTMPGTRPGGAIAAAWAGLMAMGEKGYLTHTARALEAKKRLAAGVSRIPGLQLMGDAESTIVCWGSAEKAVDVYAVADQLEDKGWHLDRQQHPACVHLTVISHHLEAVDDYLRDLASSVEYVRTHPEVKSRGNAAMYGMMAKVPFRFMVKDAVQKVMEGMYGPTGQLPDLSSPTAAGDGLVGKIMARYGDQALKALDTYDELKNQAKAQLDRLRGRE